MKKNNTTTSAKFIPQLWVDEIEKYNKDLVQKWLTMSNYYMGSKPVDKRSWSKKKIDSLRYWFNGLRYRLGEWIAGGFDYYNS